MNCIYLFHKSWCKLENSVLPGLQITFKACPYSIDEQKLCPNYSFGINGKPCRYISKSDRYNVLKRQGWKCNICGKKLDYSEEHNYNGVVAHIDHIHPFSDWKTYDGDINELSNLQALCPECNMKKQNKKIN